MENCKKYKVTKLENSDLKKEKEGQSIFNFIKKMKPAKRKRNIYKSFGFYLTILFLIGNAIGLIIIWGTNIYDNTVVQFLTIKDNGTLYNIWRDPKINLIVRIYPFNYTNFEAVVAGKEKPRVQEIGPYVFRENSIKSNVRFSGNENVTFSYSRTLTFLHNLSKGTLNDTIITPNAVFIAALDKASKDKLQKMGLSFILALFKSKPFIKVSSYEFLMGYDDNFSLMLRRINTLFRKEVHPPFGILSKRSGLSEDTITIGTGIPESNYIGIIKKYNDNEKLDIWNNSECNNITASDGFLFPGRLTSDSDVVYIYAKDLCRRIPLKFEKEFTDENGYPVRRFVLPKNVYSTPDINPDNSCFCSFDSCPKSGIHNVSSCFYDAPFVMSQPHFMYGDPELFESIEGLKPYPEKHTYYMDLHKNFGFPLKGHSRVQLSIEVKKGTPLSRLKPLCNGTVLPICWMDFELTSLPENLNSLMYHATFTAPLIKNLMKWGFLVLFIIVNFTLILYVRLT